MRALWQVGSGQQEIQLLQRDYWQVSECDA